MWKRTTQAATLATLSLALLVSTPATSFGQESPSAESGQTNKTTANKLIRVVQRKPVTKKGHFEVSPFFGYQPNDDFIRGYIPGVIVGWHLTEGVALEAVAAVALHSNKQLLTSVRDMNTQPEILDRMNFQVGGGIAWSPIYGKVSVLDRAILNYDFYISTGLGITGTTLEITKEGETEETSQGQTFEQDATFFDTYIGLGQRYFWRDWAAFRVEIKNYSYVQVVDENYNIRNNLFMTAGFSFLL